MGSLGIESTKGWWTMSFLLTPKTTCQLFLTEARGNSDLSQYINFFLLAHTLSPESIILDLYRLPFILGYFDLYNSQLIPGSLLLFSCPPHHTNSIDFFCTLDTIKEAKIGKILT
jgi:hypothetical protein